jgi:hypothetical protein
VKRFSVNLTDDEYNRLREVAGFYNKPMSKMLRIYLRLGLTKERPYTDMIIRKRGRDSNITIIRQTGT